jgi:hypothetical protein
VSVASLGLFESGKAVQQARRFDGSAFLKASLIQDRPQRYLGRFSVKHEHYTCIWIKCRPFIRFTTRGFQDPHLIQHWPLSVVRRSIEIHSIHMDHI